MPQSKIRFLISFMMPYRRRMLLVMSVTAVKALLVMAPPLLIKEMFDRVIAAGDQDPYTVLSAGLLVIPVLIAVLTFVQILYLAVVGQRIVFDIRNALFRHLESLSLRFYGRYGTGMLVNRLMGDTTTIQTILNSSLLTVVSDVVVCSVAIVAAILINWKLGCVLLVIVMAFIANYQYLRNRLLQAKRQTLRTMDRMSSTVQERLNLNLTVRSYARESFEHRDFVGHTRESIEHGSAAGVGTVDFASNTELLTYAGWGLIYFCGCYYYMHGEMSYGSVIALTTYAMYVLTPAVRFSNLARQFQDVSIALDRLFELHRAEPEVAEIPKPIRVNSLQGNVTFDHVDFQYEKNSPVLRDFHIDVAAGETIALVGQTGCGKSTVLNLVFRFYDVINGTVRIDGIDIRHYKLHDLRSHFGIVLQEPVLFEASIAENIRFANARLSMADVERAADMAKLLDYINDLPDGFDTIVGGRSGITLSAGQQQQLTIARAIAADPRILVMDEATSSLDSESEAKIQAALDHVLHGRTSFIVAHRLSTIRNASRIAMMDQGHIVELGSHDELMAIPDGRYRHLYDTHLSGGVGDE